MWLSDISIRRPVTTLTIMAAIIIFGWLGFRHMGMDLMPEVDFPIVTVQTTLLGASPEVMDQDVTDVLEQQINTISGLRTLQSQSYEGFSQIVAEFELSKDVDVAANEVRDKVNLAKTELPSDIDEPLVDKFDLGSMPVMWVSVSSTGNYRTLAEFAEKFVKERLQSVMGVGNIEVSGLREREIRVWLDPDRMQARNLTAQDIMAAIQLKHIELPGGRIETDAQEYTIKVQGEFDSVDAFSNLVITEHDGAVTYLKDVARIDDSSEDLRSIAKYNGKPTIGLGIRKQSGANSIAVARSIRTQLTELQKYAPPNTTIEVAYDTTKFIEQSMDGVQEDIIFGIILTAIIMYIFLREIRITFISILSIPISLIGGFIAMNAMDFTVNNLTMLAMSLAVGLVIDDTIVVLENIFRHVENGKNRKEASSIGASEVTLAVIASTSSIAAVFIPVAFMKGVIGRFFFQFGLTVALTVVISALVSLTLTPFMCSRLVRHQKSHGRFYNFFENFFTGMERFYSGILRYAVHHRVLMVALAILFFISAFAILPFIGKEFMTSADESRFNISLEMPTGTSLKQTGERVLDMEKVLEVMPEVENFMTSIGSSSGGMVNKGNIIVNLVPKKARTLSQNDLMQQVRDAYSKYTDMIFSVGQVNEMAGGRGADVEFIIQGPGVEQLDQVSSNIVHTLKMDPRFIDVDTDIRLNKPDIKVHVNRHLADDLGVDVRSISNEIYALFGGISIAKYKEGGYRYDIGVRALPEFRKTPSDLEKISIRNRRGELIKAPNLITYEVSRGPNAVNRYNRRLAVTLLSNLKGIQAGEAITTIEEIADRLLPKDGKWNIQPSGMSKIFLESFQYLTEALLLSILVIYMVLAIQFESFIHPFTIMISLPLTMIGVFGALLLTGETLNIFSFIGIIMLMGIVTKNGILLVDFANQARELGVSKVDAILQAGQLRLRPILMTAASTAIGVVPVALALSEGGEMRAPMAIAVIGGITTSTLLTLLIIPVIYLVNEDLSERFIRLIYAIRALFGKHEMVVSQENKQ